jgi:hypothetical protein
MKVKVQVLTETTVWSKVKEFTMPAHDYFINPVTKRLLAYRKQGTDELIRFAGKGLQFDRRGRTFKVKWRYI